MNHDDIVKQGRTILSKLPEWERIPEGAQEVAVQAYTLGHVHGERAALSAVSDEAQEMSVAREEYERWYSGSGGLQS